MLEPHVIEASGLEIEVHVKPELPRIEDVPRRPEFDVRIAGDLLDVRDGIGIEEVEDVDGKPYPPHIVDAEGLLQPQVGQELIG